MMMKKAKKGFMLHKVGQVFYSNYSEVYHISHIDKNVFFINLPSIHATAGAELENAKKAKNSRT
jgi:hypothetical protein